MFYKELIDDNCEQNQKNVERNSFGIYIRLLYCFFSVTLLIGFSCIANGRKGIFYLLFSFCPSFVYLYLFKKKIKKRIKFSHIVEMILYGAILSIIFAGFLEYIFSLLCFYFCHTCFLKNVKESYSFACLIVILLYFFLGVAYVEEFSKICPIFFINANSIVNKNEYTELPIIENHNFKSDITYEDNEHNNKFNKFKYIYVDDKFEYIYFSLCSSAGFSSTENLIYFTLTSEDNFLTIIILRNIICVLLHMSCSGISSYNIINNRNNENRNGMMQSILSILKSLFLSSLFHAIYDYSIYYSSLNIPEYQISFFKALFMYSFFSMLFIFFVIIKGIV
ncbi:protease, putative [Plasmodium yoelii]|nr:protease, putative [Plasmodium yoelii]CDU18973.1 conserved Plasmodium protein, unknown function [Plasmodium yoelii]VTZ79558.1 protease, putative [Plasmodium yoelii]|eukprot:XP_022812427.1 protease, putative [Plasmodium yoelii]